MGMETKVMATRVIAFFSERPGQGKTIACVNVAAALGELGKLVLVIDLDPKLQALLLLWRAYAATALPDGGGASIFLNGAFQPTPVSRVLVGSPFAGRPPTKDGTDRSDVEATYDRFLANTSPFDFVLIDTSSTDQWTQVQALW